MTSTANKRHILCKAPQPCGAFVGQTARGRSHFRTALQCQAIPCSLYDTLRSFLSRKNRQGTSCSLAVNGGYIMLIRDHHDCPSGEASGHGMVWLVLGLPPGAVICGALYGTRPPPQPRPRAPAAATASAASCRRSAAEGSASRNRRGRSPRTGP